MAQTNGQHHDGQQHRGRLQGKVAIITGAGAGIGEAIARKFALEGARLVLSGLPDDPLGDVADDLREQGYEAETYLGDVGEEEHARACIQTALDTYGRLDVLVNNAGMFPETDETQDFELENFDRLLHNNLRSAFLMTKLALPHLQETRGNVVSAGSESAFNGLANNTTYGGTKGFMQSFMKGVAVEQAKHGVRANCVSPGPIDTAWTHKETGPMTEQMEESLIKATPMGRRGTPEEIANVYAFLASDEASYVTGACWLVDGGQTPAKGPVGDQVPDELREQPSGRTAEEHQLEGRTS